MENIEEKLDLAVVMPVYNEEGAIEKVINGWNSELSRLGMRFKLHAYNDGSRDGTLAALTRLAQSNSHLVVHDKPNSGHGPTILEGYRQNAGAEWIFQVDSDDEMGPEWFGKLWEKREGYDFILGRRSGRQSPLPRQVVSFVSRAAVSVFYGKSVYDVNSPYRLMRVSAFLPCFFSIPRKTFAPNVAVSGYAAIAGLKTLELEVPHKERATGVVSIRKLKLLKAAARSFMQTIRYRLFECRKALKLPRPELRPAGAVFGATPYLAGKELYGWEDCAGFEIGRIWDLYRRFVNKCQVDLISSFGFGRETVKKAEGVWIETSSGRRILDFTGGIGVLSHGHNHPRIIAARKKYQSEARMEVHKNFFSPYIAGLSHNIAQLMPENLDISYFCNSGAEAVEGALKMAYKYHGGKRKYVLHSDISFHGKTLGAASVTGSPELHFKFPGIPHTAAFEYGNIESVKALISEKREDGRPDIFAVILEPINASSLRACSKEFLAEIREICSREDIILIFDEVYTGWAKCGELFSFMNYGVVPDIVTYAKSFGGGKSSISGYTARDNVFMKAYGNYEDATLHSSTYNGFGEETITAIEAVNIIVEEDFVSKSKHIHSVLNPALKALQRKYPDIIKDVRGSGALNGIIIYPPMEALRAAVKMIPSSFFQNPRFINQLATASVISHLYNEHGILTFYGSNREIPLIISPSLVIKDEELHYFLAALDQTLSLGLPVLVARFIEQKLFQGDAPKSGGRVH